MNDPYPYAPPQQAYVPPQQTYVPYPVYQQSTSNGLGITSFVLAMVSMVLSIIPLVGLIDWLLLPLGALFGLLGLFKQGKSKGLAIAGLVLNIIGIGVMLIAGAFLLAVLGSAGSQPH